MGVEEIPGAGGGENHMTLKDRQIEALTLRRAKFVYEATRLVAIAANAPAIPKPWSQRESEFRAQFLDVIEHQTGDRRSASPAQLHQAWVQAYREMGWVHGETRDPVKRTHPDMVPYQELGQLEQDKDAVFIALCEIARRWIY